MSYKKKMKFMISTAILLSAISLVFSIAAAGSVLYSQNKGSSSGDIISQKLSSTDTANDSDVTKVQQATSPKNTSSEDGNKTTEVEQQQTETKQQPVTKPVSPKAKKIVYLTFDDGPSKYTNQIVSILEEKGIHATFFVIGNQLKGNEQKLKDAHDAGNYIGLHSMTHNKKILYNSGSSARFIKEFQKEQQLVNNILGYEPVLIRAPYGSKPEIKGKFLDDIADAGFKMWDWTVDSKDWYYTGKPDRILQEVKRQVDQDTEVILMHEKSQTVEALPKIIDYLHNKGYAFAVYKPNQHISVNFAKDERL
ncbi:peptidoglycan/xylan/chitin deacetylase (PgdA/CDA1 family) [Fontibacillus solani]|uniref:Peptidoglycan/xylan/chitin deacetylase (PgdA/CDA1 family) n=1 Tax=Fontibacillus solani TaxID=1572857 RepID=A0A7W3SPS6_9BACL|nr:polysaccharide deacetylase family protein [Fontibacillus solani]MBA9084000.1 peptidoglycan/xylan/chitin deacetylase (PgdA/CDA1 family) [Fontibacillus solani]